MLLAELLMTDLIRFTVSAFQIVNFVIKHDFLCIIYSLAKLIPYLSNPLTYLEFNPHKD